MRELCKEERALGTNACRSFISYICIANKLHCTENDRFIVRFVIPFDLSSLLDNPVKKLNKEISFAVEVCVHVRDSPSVTRNTCSNCCSGFYVDTLSLSRFIKGLPFLPCSFFIYHTKKKLMEEMSQEMINDTKKSEHQISFQESWND